MQTISLSSLKIRALVAEGENTLAQSPHPERARRDAETLFLHLLQRRDPGRNNAWLIAHGDATSDLGNEFQALINRRLAGEPMQYILGETEFYGLPFRVTQAVLIPRPETEHLVEEVLRRAANFARPRIVDIGTGSGCIAVALARRLPHAAIAAIDLSLEALGVARENATLNKVADRIRFLEGDLLVPVAGESFEIVVSNPPYVPTADRESLSVEVRDHEPALALFAGDNGLDTYLRLIPAAYAALAPGGLLALEIGFGQRERVMPLLVAAGFLSIEVEPDLQGIDRVICAQRGQV
jgi:release factor glutamine methyltransferase